MYYSVNSMKYYIIKPKHKKTHETPQNKKKLIEKIEIIEHDVNEQIINELKTMKDCEIANGEVYKILVYNRTIATIQKEFISKNKTVKKGTELSKYKGIGLKMCRRIDEILKTGHLREADDIRADPNINAIFTFTNIYGIGPCRAKDLVRISKITSIDELRSKKNQLGLLTKNQKIGLKYYEELLERIPRAEVQLHESYIMKLVKKVEKAENIKITWSIAGSYRRGAKDCGDIDILITCKPHKPSIINKLITKMTEYEYLTHELSRGTLKLNGLCKLPEASIHRRIDIFYSPPEKHAFALLHYTGSKTFNIMIRHHCIKNGMKLTDKAIRYYAGKGDDNTIPTMYSEHDIFDFLKIDYVEPTERDSQALRQPHVGFSEQ